MGASQSKLELVLEMKNKAISPLIKFKSSVKSSVSTIKSDIGSISTKMDKTAKEVGGIKVKLMSVSGNPFQGLKNHATNFKASTLKAFSAIKQEVPILAKSFELIGNPYVLAIAGVVALSSATFKLGGHLFDVSKEIRSNQKEIVASFGVTGELMETLTAKTKAISDVTKTEISELTTAANALSKEYKNLTIADSLDLIKKGLQATNGKLELREIQEYSSQMKAAGFSAQQFIALSVAGKKQGVFDDKAVDAVKEFNLRIREMTPAAKDALKGIGLNSDKILKGLDSGSLKTHDILKQVSAAMAKVKTQARQTATADLFGGPGEDAGERFLLSLAKMDLSAKGITAGMSGILQHQNKQIHFNEKIYVQQQAIAEVLNPIRNRFELLKLKATELFYSTISSGLSWVKDNVNSLKTTLIILKHTLIGVGGALTMIKAPAIASFLALKIGAIASTVASWTLAGSVKAIGLAVKSIPGVGWILAIIGALVTAYHTSDTFRASVHGVIASLKEVLKLARPIGRMLAGLATGNFIEIGLGFKELKQAWSYINFKGAYKEAFNEVMSEAKERRKKQKSTTTSNVVVGDDSDPSTTDPVNSPGTGTPDLSGMQAVESSSGRIQHLEINIESFHKGDNILRPEADGQEVLTLDDLEKWYQETLMRVNRNIELSAQ